MNIIRTWAVSILVVLFWQSPATAETPLAPFQKAIDQNMVYRGVWDGTFRRYDAAGQLVEEFPSRIVAMFDPSDPDLPYTQTNTYTPPGGETESITSRGAWRDGMLVFENPRVDGYSANLTPAQDPSQRSAVLHLNFKDGSGLAMYEIITVGADGKTRSRMSQYLIGDQVVRRTLIDEVKVEETFSPID